jgi:hypothetical protein
MTHQCSNCQISTAGLHEWNCPNNPRHGYVNADSTGTTSTLPKDIGIRINPVAPFKINDGSTVDTPRTCENCKWCKKYPPDIGNYCENINTPVDTMDTQHTIEFGCNFWESK